VKNTGYEVPQGVLYETKRQYSQRSYRLDFEVGLTGKTAWTNCIP